MIGSRWLAGTLAALCSTISFVPQACPIVRTRDGAISPLTYSLTMTGFALGTAYGVGLGEWPLIVTNSEWFVLSVFILTLLPRAKNEAVADTIDPAP